MRRSRGNRPGGMGALRWALFLGLGFLGLVGATGCDQYTNWMTWGPLINPGNTSSLGLPAMPAFYYPFLFF